MEIIKEHKSHDNFKQISYVFMAKVIEDTKNLDLTEKEQAEGAKLLWLDEKTALYKIIECINNLQVSTYENIYYSKFIVFRDTKILNYYLRNK